MKASAHATWQGDWKQGDGAISTTSAVLKNQPYSYASRFDGGPRRQPRRIIGGGPCGLLQSGAGE
ncbi:hypothetical protein [Rugamonas sp.]|uniref:hypothetical protein n=1 Tax=Rugamonas sp. TaxID=1926287 RepID=UPI0025DB2D25|nr:hypothetical protein [Rugamonas sp.]